ncbi:prolyl oligopeptidase family serine peptidase [Roseateles sp.]|uniref:alpha/beta hydrolase n=1 Tax=Roseateles sp. TaxID=1971397 RepID=UPI0025DAFFEF|nr:prolyl oligopeptidase family serine peptidase [Roseateles sp.]MBV8034596.1 prolyl oligopeptidase family serine peptidase [Roseateles sp.]
MNPVIPLSEGAPNLFDGDAPDRVCRRPTRAELHAYPSPTAARGRALVYAGGGYLQLMHDKEGVEVAQWLNTLGLDAYVLVHRLPGQDDHPFDIALQDGRLALAHLATLPPLPLLHVGMSSGGHLAGVMACQRTDMDVAGAVIGYAPLNANHRDHKVPVGKPDFPPPEKQAFYDAWPIGIAGQPHGLPPCPVFLAYALHDPVVPVQHALNLIVAAQQRQLDVEAHVFAQAEHGFALRGLAGTHDQWPALAARWMATQLDDTRARQLP